MKKLILFSLLTVLLMGCGKFSDGTSVWQDGLWIIPLMTFLGGCFFLYRAIYKSKLGSERQLPGGGYEDLKKNIPFYKQNVFIFSTALFIATIVIIIMVNNDK